MKINSEINSSVISKLILFVIRFLSDIPAVLQSGSCLSTLRTAADAHLQPVARLYSPASPL